MSQNAEPMLHTNVGVNESPPGADPATSTEGTQVGREVENEEMEDGISNGTWDQVIKELRVTPLSQIIDANDDFFVDIMQQWDLNADELNQIELGRYGPSGKPAVSYINYLASTDVTIDELCNALTLCKLDKACEKLLSIAERRRVESKRDVVQFSNLFPQDQHPLAPYLAYHMYMPSKKTWKHIAEILDHSTIIPQVESNSIPEARYSKAYTFLMVLAGKSCSVREFKRKLTNVSERVPAVSVIYDAFMEEASYLETKRNKKAIAENTVIEVALKQEENGRKKLNFLVQLYLHEVGCNLAYEQIDAGSRLSCVLSRAISKVVSDEVCFEFFASQANSELDPGSIVTNYHARIKFVFKPIGDDPIPVYYTKVDSAEAIKLQKQIKAICKKTCEEFFKEKLSLVYPGWYIDPHLFIKLSISKKSREEWKVDELDAVERIINEAVRSLSLDIRLDACTLRRDIIYECHVLYKFTGYLRYYLMAELIPEALQEKLQKAILDIPLTVGNIIDQGTAGRSSRKVF